MAEMTRTVSIPGLGSEFDAFLFATVDEEKNGMLLSVLSALARLGVDPWQEAAKLAQLPEETATRRLTTLLEALPDAAPVHRDPVTVAARLIGLLPHVAEPVGSSNPAGAGVATKPSATLIWTIVVMLFMSAQWIAASHQPPASGADVSAPISSTVKSDATARP
jgi:hypothetical protein